MKASIAHNVRPTTLLLGKDSTKRWSDWDSLLARAYQRFLNEVCQQCGGPKYICHTDDNEIQFKLGKDECASTAMAERERERISKLPDGQRPYGLQVFGEPYLIDEAIEAGKEFSDYRRPYLVDQAKRRGMIPEDYAE